MTTFLAIDPDGVRALARALDHLADDARAIATEARRWAAEAALDVEAPMQLDRLGAAGRAASMVLRHRSEAAAGFAVSIAGAFAAESRRPPLSGGPRSAAACVAGPTSFLGTGSPCDPVERMELVTVAGGVSAPGPLVGPSIEAAHMYRIEHLRSGRLRVTRLDRVVAGVGASAGRDLTIAGLGRELSVGVSADGAAHLLVATGDTFEIDADELGHLIAADLLDRAASVPPVQGLRVGELARLARAASGVADRFGWGPLDGLVHRVHTALSARLSSPVSRFVEGGVEGRGSVALVAKALFGVSVAGAVHAVAGLERREREQRDVLYVDIGGELQASVHRSLFGPLADDGQADLRLGVVRDRTSQSLVAIELSLVQRRGGDAERRTAVVDLTDPVARRLTAELRDGITDPRRLAELVAALLALGSTRIDITRLRRSRDDTTGLVLAGTGLRLVRQRYEVIDAPRHPSGDR